MTLEWLELAVLNEIEITKIILWVCRNLTTANYSDETKEESIAILKLFLNRERDRGERDFCCY